MTADPIKRQEQDDPDAELKLEIEEIADLDLPSPLAGTVAGASGTPAPLRAGGHYARAHHGRDVKAYNC